MADWSTAVAEILTGKFIYDSAPAEGDDISGTLVTPSAVELNEFPAAEASAASLAALGSTL